MIANHGRYRYQFFAIASKKRARQARKGSGRLVLIQFNIFFVLALLFLTQRLQHCALHMYLFFNIFFASLIPLAASLAAFARKLSTSPRRCSFHSLLY